jgi:hypothetical protein
MVTSNFWLYELAINVVYATALAPVRKEERKRPKLNRQKLAIFISIYLTSLNNNEGVRRITPGCDLDFKLQGHCRVQLMKPPDP